MVFEAKNFDNLIGIKGFSEIMLKNHFALYRGYVANINKLDEALRDLLKEGKTATPEFAELKRRLGWEFNGMRLHELYFGSLIKELRIPSTDSALTKQITKDFGIYGNWEKDFRAVGAMRGIGWVVLYYDVSAKRLFNCWINEHDAGHLAGAAPLLVMDVFEHAYITDYELRRADYIEAFFKAIDWKTVEKRFEYTSK
ncbi:Fe-Mn family superoxide dismutase [archaeon]|nr:Fe-Mn family superoxide dismutase [Nanoarchaeota archaeon]MBU4299810.1 Fe-Mn family superoxide dismutase [Nanoarchaeota archaeon]MBU4451279.1 Fe-Mn family superoxide dismutase [Nanoarchaeota archaeon]MCG2723568.1 Fe-Mn family superoxide dismutase [archaeon]